MVECLSTSDGKLEQEMNRRIGASSAIMRALLRSIVVKRELSQKAKLSIYWSIFVPTLTCSHEIWIVTERMRSQIQAAEMGFLQKVAGLGLRIRGRELLNRAAAPPHRRSQLRWFGHLVGVLPGCFPLEVFRASPTGRKPWGRLKTCWRDYISLLPWESLGIPQEELEHLTEDRDRLKHCHWLCTWTHYKEEAGFNKTIFV